MMILSIVSFEDKPSAKPASLKPLLIDKIEPRVISAIYAPELIVIVITAAVTGSMHWKN